MPMSKIKQGASELVRVKVPASSANLGPGFDALGIALSLYAWIEMAPADKTSVTIHDQHMLCLPKDKTNLLVVTARRVFEEAGVPMPELHIAVKSDIPLTRGLGSSASAIVGALGAANELLGRPLPDAELFRLASSIECHPDNVGAALFGGIVSAVWDGQRAEHVRIDPPSRLTTLVAIPSYELSTGKARAALPEQVSRADAVYNLSRSSLLVAALATGDLEKIGFAMSDRLHQPHRAPLVPGLEKVLAEAQQYGALGAALSGAGPTAIAFVDDASPRKAELERFMKEALQENGASVETLWLAPSAAGLQTLSAEGTFLEAAAEGGVCR